ncbi:MAG: DUF6019 family protein [Bifidobacterium sp.]|nr:DUF6019 family protein [Bifidobacterium sp.]
METALWSSLFTIIIVAIAIWALYYVIRSAVRNGVADALKETGVVKTPGDEKASAMQQQREALQEQRIRQIVQEEQAKKDAKSAQK